MKKFNNILFLIFGFLFLFSCQQEQNIEPYVRENTLVTELTATLLSSGFEYNTTSNVALSITLANNSNEPLNNVYLKVFAENPEDEYGNYKSTILPVFKGMTDEAGKLDVEFSIPTYATKLFVYPEYIGVNSSFELSLVSKKTTLVFNNETDNIKFDATLEKGFVAGLITLGTWNTLGVPNYLCGQDVVSKDFLKRVNATLPEKKSLPETSPLFFNSNVTTNLILNEKSDVYITFLHEGAGMTNAFGYYTYEIGQEPKNVLDINNLTVIFPNSSYLKSGGGLFSGDKVYLGEFPKNTVIAWVLVAQGWNNNTLTSGYYKVYSDKWLNPETNENLKQHSVLVYDPETKRYVIGFEDLNRQKSSDNDFNDIVFYATVTNENAVSGDGIVNINDLVDTDGDGVGDLNDDYPNDPTLAFNNISDWSTLVYEDLWPTKGDYDFNDLVLAYRINQISNAQNKVVKILNKMSIRAIGAGFHNGFAIQFPINPTNVEYVKGTLFNTSNYFQISANGTELNQSTTVIPIFNDAYFAFTQKGMKNVYKDSPFEQPDTFEVEIKFSVPQSFSSLGGLPFNPFIIKNGNRNIEIHLPYKLPTDLADNSLFGSQDDNTNLALGKTYITKDNKPWALNLAGEFYHPYEKNNISGAYLKYNEWATSNGLLFPDWYLDIDGYKDMSKIYPRP